MLLALPENQFIEASVDNEDKSWLRRFHAQLQKHPTAPVLAQSTELPKWLQLKRGYDIGSVTIFGFSVRRSVLPRRT